MQPLTKRIKHYEISTWLKRVEIRVILYHEQKHMKGYSVKLLGAIACRSACEKKRLFSLINVSVDDTRQSGTDFPSGSTSHHASILQITLLPKIASILAYPLLEGSTLRKKLRGCKGNTCDTVCEGKCCAGCHRHDGTLPYSLEFTTYL